MGEKLVEAKLSQLVTLQLLLLIYKLGVSRALLVSGDLDNLACLFVCGFHILHKVPGSFGIWFNIHVSPFSIL